MTPSSRKAPKDSSGDVTAAQIPTTVNPLFSLPIVGPTTLEDAVFYTTCAAVAVAELVSWPVAGLLAGGHALHQRSRNVVRTGAFGEVREGLIETFEDVA